MYSIPTVLGLLVTLLAVGTVGARIGYAYATRDVRDATLTAVREALFAARVHVCARCAMRLRAIAPPAKVSASATRRPATPAEVTATRARVPR